LSPFGVADFSFNYRILDGKFMVKGAINNLLDKEFVEVYGFSTKGRNYNIGVSYIF